MSKEIVNVSEDEEVEYFVTLPVVSHVIFSIERPEGLTKNDFIGSITKEDVYFGLRDCEQSDIHHEDVFHTISLKGNGYKIQIQDAETDEEVL